MLFFAATRGDYLAWWPCTTAMNHGQGHDRVKVLGIEADVNITEASGWSALTRAKPWFTWGAPMARHLLLSLPPSADNL